MRAALRPRSVVLVLAVLATLLVAQASMPARGGGFGGDRNKADQDASREPVRTVHLFTPMSPKAAETWLRLQEPIKASFPHESPFEDFLKSLKEATRGEDKEAPAISIYVDPVGLQEAEKTMTSPIVIDLEDVPAATVLELTLRQLGLKYYLQKDGILVITAESHEDIDAIGDPSRALLDGLDALQAEVAALRREVTALRRNR
jgi:hypothetical protein